MRSAWVIGRETIKILKKDYEKPSDDEVVVRVRLCRICGTDLHFSFIQLNRTAVN